MTLKWGLVLAIVAVVLFTVVVLAIIGARRDSKKIEEQMEVKVKEEAKETIKQAKEWIKQGEKQGGFRMLKVKNENTLGELLSLEPTPEDYKEFINILSGRVRELYKEYQFFLYEPNKNDLVSGYLVQFQVMGHEEVYNQLFVHAMDRGLDMDKVDSYFYEALMSEDIIPIGEGIIIDEEGTGVSPIKSGDDVRVIISFVTEEYKLRQEEAEEEKSE